MKITHTIIGLLVFFSSAALAEDKSCHETANTQLEMNVCAASDSEHAEKELNEVYQAILKKYQKSPQFLLKLKAAQRAWLAFREAEIKAIFPLEKDINLHYGSVYPMCFAMTEAGITLQRIKELRKWLGPFEEGDVCQGSVGNLEENNDK